MINKFLIILIINFFLVDNYIITVQINKIVQIKNDKKALNYCKQNSNSYVAIVWPIAEGKDREIESVFNSFGKIIYKKQIIINPSLAVSILRKAHPSVGNMSEHLKWYFPKKDIFKKPVRLFIFECSSIEKVLKCKYAIRKLFNLQYRSIHVNDTYSETLDLANIFFV